MSEAEKIEAERCAVYLKVLADSTRFQIVKLLRSGPLTVGDISQFLELDLTTTSHHLRVLYHAAITTTERDGKYIYYSLNQDLVGAKRRLDELNFGCCKLELGPDTRQSSALQR